MANPRPRERDISAQRLRELFLYEDDSGILRHRTNKKGRAIEGSVAGHIRKNGYVMVKADSGIFRAHRVIWAIVYGEWPKMWLDHINGIRSDNRISNLREVSPSENNHNFPVHRSGRLVGAIPRGSRWLSQRTINGRSVVLGYFNTADEAHQAYLRATP